MGHEVEKRIVAVRVHNGRIGIRKAIGRGADVGVGSVL